MVKRKVKRNVKKVAKKSANRSFTPARANILIVAIVAIVAIISIGLMIGSGGDSAVLDSEEALAGEASKFRTAKTTVKTDSNLRNSVTEVEKATELTLPDLVIGKDRVVVDPIAFLGSIGVDVNPVEGLDLTNSGTTVGGGEKDGESCSGGCGSITCAGENGVPQFTFICSCIGQTCSCPSCGDSVSGLDVNFNPEDFHTADELLDLVATLDKFVSMGEIVQYSFPDWTN
jgi:hypothetical protein